MGNNNRVLPTLLFRDVVSIVIICFIIFFNVFHLNAKGVFSITLSIYSFAIPEGYKFCKYGQAITSSLFGSYYKCIQYKYQTFILGSKYFIV